MKDNTRRTDRDRAADIIAYRHGTVVDHGDLPDPDPDAVDPGTRALSIVGRWEESSRAGA